MMSIKETFQINKKAIIDSYLGGASTCELGRQYGSSNAAVWKFLKAQGVPIRQTKQLEPNLGKIQPLLESGMSARKIAKHLGLAEITVQRAAKKLGIDISHRRRKRKEELKAHIGEIVTMYKEGYGSYLIGKRFGCFEATVLQILRAAGIESRPLRIYPLNEEYFKVIDTPLAAWALGVFWSDGCNQPQRPCVSLSMTDRDVVEKVRAAMSYGGPIREVPPRDKGRRTQYAIVLGSRIMSDIMTNLGCVRRKSYVGKFPTSEAVPPHLVPSFLRGLSDGNGCIWRTKKGVWGYSIAGTKEVCEGALEATRSLIGLVGGVRPYKPNMAGHTTYMFSVSPKHNIRVFLDWIYCNSTPESRMNRKFEKYQQFLKEQNRVIP